MYEIREDYIHGKSNISFDENKEDGSHYWTKERISSSLVYQYSFYKWVKKKCNNDKSLRVLDIGCGPGTKLMHFFGSQGYTVVGIDQKDAVNYCRSKFKSFSNASFHVDNFDDPSDSDIGHFDIIICSDVIEHLEQPDNLMSFIKRFANHNTRIFISTPERERLRGKNNIKSPKSDYLREWSQKEFVKYSEKSGLKVIESRIFTFMKPNLYYPHGLKYIKNILTGILNTNHGIEAKLQE